MINFYRWVYVGVDIKSCYRVLFMGRFKYVLCLVFCFLANNSYAEWPVDYSVCVTSKTHTAVRNIDGESITVWSTYPGPSKVYICHPDSNYEYDHDNDLIPDCDIASNIRGCPVPAQVCPSGTSDLVYSTSTYCGSENKPASCVGSPIPSTWAGNFADIYSKGYRYYSNSCYGSKTGVWKVDSSGVSCPGEGTTFWQIMQPTFPSSACHNDCNIVATGSTVLKTEYENCHNVEYKYTGTQTCVGDFSIDYTPCVTTPDPDPDPDPDPSPGANDIVVVIDVTGVETRLDTLIGSQSSTLTALQQGNQNTASVVNNTAAIADRIDLTNSKLDTLNNTMQGVGAAPPGEVKLDFSEIIENVSDSYILDKVGGVSVSQDDELLDVEDAVNAVIADVDNFDITTEVSGLETMSNRIKGLVPGGVECTGTSISFISMNSKSEQSVHTLNCNWVNRFKSFFSLILYWFTVVQFYKVATSPWSKWEV